MPNTALIIGGGPAGLATAIALARLRIGAVVVERTAYEDLRVGEHLAPAGVLQLRALDVGYHLRLESHGLSSGVDAYWGSGTASHMDYFRHPGQRGVNLSRPRFDAELARGCERSGATVLREASLLRADSVDSGWDVSVAVNGDTRHFAVGLIVDASGRAATFARRQGARVRAGHRQIAVACFAEQVEGGTDTRSTVETVETGWWYSAPIGTERRIVMFMTDDDLLPKAEDRHAWWLRELARTTRLPHGFREADGFREGRVPGGLVLRPARSQHLDAMCGANWLAVGDAAMAFDPLSSQGIVKAFDHAFRAASSIAAHFAGDADALQRLASGLEAEYAAYRATQARYYRIETRWRASPFWQRRHAQSAA